MLFRVPGSSLTVTVKRGTDGGQIGGAMANHKWHKTTFPGVRYREHRSRKHGVQKDRYFAIRYYVDGRRVEEGLGWASEGMSGEEAFIVRSELKKAARFGHGDTTLAEKRERIKAEKEEQALEEQRQAKLNVSFKEYFERYYEPDILISNKSSSVKKAAEHVAVWIDPVVGNTPIRELGLDHVKRIRKNHFSKERSPRTIQYVFNTFGAVWEDARQSGFVSEQSPTKLKVFKKGQPKVDNRKERFLNEDEILKLLKELRTKSETIYGIALTSLEVGFRFGEIVELTWDRIDFEAHEIHLTRTKNKKSRWIPLTSHLADYFHEIGPGLPGEFVFKNRFGEKIERLSNSYYKAVRAAQLNEGITDNKKIANFHTLRHTYAARLLRAGVSLYEVSKLLGHSSIKVTERYGHLVQDDLKQAVKKMELSLSSSEKI